jgi:hypothetical protein
MNSDQFTPLARWLTAEPARRSFLRGLMGVALGLAALRHSDDADARKKRRKKTPQLNAFGCLNVGQKCRGKDALCCSGKCAGKKPKRGRKDRRTCVAHDTGGCPKGDPSEACGGDVETVCTAATGLEGVCDRTTGNAGFCTVSGDCFPCRKDADCQPLCGPEAACIRCEETCSGVGGTACVGPSLCEGF